MMRGISWVTIQEADKKRGITKTDVNGPRAN